MLLLSSGSVAPCRWAWVDLASSLSGWSPCCVSGVPSAPGVLEACPPTTRLGYLFILWGIWRVCGWPASAVSVSAHSTSLQQYLYFSLKALLFCHYSQLCISCVCCEAGVTSPILGRQRHQDVHWLKLSLKLPLCSLAPEVPECVCCAGRPARPCVPCAGQHHVVLACAPPAPSPGLSAPSALAHPCGSQTWLVSLWGGHPLGWVGVCWVHSLFDRTSILKYGFPNLQTVNCCIYWSLSWLAVVGVAICWGAVMRAQWALGSAGARGTAVAATGQAPYVKTEPAQLPRGWGERVRMQHVGLGHCLGAAS